MRSIVTAERALAGGDYDASLARAYSRAQVTEQRTRWNTLLQRAAQHPFFRDSPHPPRLFRSPGRTEIGGNHTDHNHGLAIVGTLCSDIIAVVAPRTDHLIRIHNLDRDTTDEIDCGTQAPIEAEKGTSAALVRGVVAALAHHQVEPHGFDALTTSDVAEGGGLSSSAAFESLVAVIEYTLRGGAPPLSVIDLAKAGQYAENEYFGKPCGLEDQIGALNGGITQIDFADFDAIKLEQRAVDFAEHALQLAVVDSKESHADLTAEYAAIPYEMKAIASHYQKETLRDVVYAEVIADAARLRALHGDRALLRALHFFRENERVRAQIAALRAGDMRRFLELVRQSGYSSWMWAQNCIPHGRVREQAYAYALAVSEAYFAQKGIAERAACRVHGGGFAGTIQLFLPQEEAAGYKHYIEQCIAPDVYLPLHISLQGAGEIVAMDDNNKLRSQ